MKRRRHQYGSLTKKSNRLSEDVWQFRLLHETTHEGRRYRRSRQLFGTVAKSPTKTDALRIVEPLRLRLNLHHRFGRPISISALIDHYIERELPEWRHSTQRSHSSTITRWILPRWGDRLLEETKPVAVEEWSAVAHPHAEKQSQSSKPFHLIYEHARRCIGDHPAVVLGRWDFGRSVPGSKWVSSPRVPRIAPEAWRLTCPES